MHYQKITQNIDKQMTNSTNITDSKKRHNIITKSKLMHHEQSAKMMSYEKSSRCITHKPYTLSCSCCENSFYDKKHE